MEIIAIIISTLCLVLLTILVFRKKENNVNPVVEAVLQLLQRELKDNRSELSIYLKENREEISTGFDKLTQKLEGKLTIINEELNKSCNAIETKNG